MHGFLFCNKELNVLKLREAGWTDCIYCGKWQIWYNPLPKFENDHLFFETEKYVVLLDGVILNINELMFQNREMNWRECFINLYQRNDIPDCLRGSFRGLIYNKITDEILAFTNHTGEKTVYYTKDAAWGGIIASHVNIIRDCFCSNGRGGFTADLQAHYELLLTGSILHGKSPFEGIRRLTAGQMLFFTKNETEVRQYHVFRNIPEHECSLDECIDRADILMRQAVDRIFRKSKEYGYQAECDLSGGLDSRFATWVAHDLGYNNFLNVCYCVEGNLDHKISKQIARDLGNDYFFLPMGAYIMRDVDEKTLLAGGQVLYMLATGALHALKKMDTSNIGLMCTGLLGEMQNAYWVEGISHTSPKYISNRKSYYKTLDIPDDYIEKYENYEQMNLYEYSYVLFLLSSLVRQESVEVTSPFLDADYMDFIFRIPLKWRKNYYFSQAYMCKKYPKAASYNWQGKRMPVDKHFRNQFYVPKMIDDIRNFVVKCTNKSLRILHIQHQFFRKDDMNPIETWYRNDKAIREYMQSYFDKNIKFVTDDLFKRVLSDMFQNSKLATDKVQVINVIAVWKNYIR